MNTRQNANTSETDLGARKASKTGAPAVPKIGAMKKVLLLVLVVGIIGLVVKYMIDEA